MLACLALAGGCGGDDNGGGGDSNNSSDNSSDSSGGSTSNDANVQQIIDSCKRSVNAAQSLSSAAKKDLNDLCEKAGSGDEKAARQASQDVCVRIVKDTVPAGSGRDQAVTACKQTTQ
jgi:hypothetical protein